MVFLAISFMVSNPSPDNLGWYTLVPSVFVITFIFWTKEIILAYILGGLMGHYMVNRGDFSCPNWDTVYDTVMSDNYVWLVLRLWTDGKPDGSDRAFRRCNGFQPLDCKIYKTRKSALCMDMGFGLAYFYRRLFKLSRDLVQVCLI